MFSCFLYVVNMFRWECVFLTVCLLNGEAPPLLGKYQIVGKLNNGGFPTGGNLNSGDIPNSVGRNWISHGGFLKTFGPPSPNISTPNLPIPHSGYNSEINETAAAKRPRKQTEAHGSRWQLGILDSALGSEFPGVFRAFWFAVFQNPPARPAPSPEFTNTL